MLAVYDVNVTPPALSAAAMAAGNRGAKAASEVTFLPHRPACVGTASPVPSLWTTRGGDRGPERAPRTAGGGKPCGVCLLLVLGVPDDRP